MNAKQLIHGLTPILAVAAVAVTAQAASFGEDFESYAAGSNMHGQGGWKGWDNSSGAGAVVSSAFSFNGTQSVNITGGSDLVHTFAGVTSGQYTFSIQQYIPSASTGQSYFILLNQYNDGGPYDWSVQTVFDLGAGTVKSDMAGSPLPLVKNQWVEIRYLIDLGTSNVSEYYNGQLLASYAWHDASGFEALAAIDLYANNAGPVYYDALSVEPVPEPTTLALLGLGTLALALRRRNA
jgi:hypothetical protein